jgi:hypothetical protein
MPRCWHVNHISTESFSSVWITDKHCVRVDATHHVWKSSPLHLFLGTAQLLTIVFTKDLIGDAASIMIVPIAAWAFTPLGQ